MGVKRGQFGSKDGNLYEVRFIGDDVSDGDMVLGVPPVTLSMASGEHKFCGFKSTTAVVNILSQVILDELYTESATGVRCEVEDVTNSIVVFDGYVLPFAFEQPHTFGYDSVTVNAVDMLTARKDVPYANLSEHHGVDMLAFDIVSGICDRIGVNEIYMHLNFNDADDVMSNASPLDVMVAQAGFLQDGMSDADVLSAICQFFGYTGHIIGRTLYMYDESCFGMYPPMGVNRYVRSFATIVNRYVWRLYTHYAPGTTSGLPFGGEYLTMYNVIGEVSVSVDRAYDGVQVTPGGSSVSVLLPDVCAKENSRENTGVLGTSTRVFQNYDGRETDYIQYRTPRESTVMDLGLGLSGEPSDDWDMSSDDPVVTNTWYGGAMLLDVQHVERRRLSRPAGEGYPPTELIVGEMKKDGLMIWLSDLYAQVRVVGRQKPTTCYSHTRGVAKLTLSWVLMRKGNWIDFTQPDEQSITSTSSTPFGNAAMIAITCGDRRYVVDDLSQSVRWQDMDSVPEVSTFYTDGAGTSLIPTQISLARFSSDVLVDMPNDGQVSVAIAWFNFPTEYYHTEGWNIYIDSLSMEGYGDDINTSCEGMRRAFSSRAGGEYLSVETMLTTRNSDYIVGPTGMNARPGVVTSTEWAAPYRHEGSKIIPMTGILLEQLSERYVSKHMVYTFEADRRILPYGEVGLQLGSSAGSVHWGTVDAYDWDIYDNKTKVRIS